MTELTCVALALIIACAFLAAVLFDARDFRNLEDKDDSDSEM